MFRNDNHVTDKVYYGAVVNTRLSWTHRFFQKPLARSYIYFLFFSWKFAFNELSIHANRWKHKEMLR